MMTVSQKATRDWYHKQYLQLLESIRNDIDRESFMDFDSAEEMLIQRLTKMSVLRGIVRGFDEAERNG